MPTLVEVNTYDLRMAWTDREWADFESWLLIEGFEVVHCTHCGRYGADANQHPSCYFSPVTS